MVAKPGEVEALERSILEIERRIRVQRARIDRLAAAGRSTYASYRILTEFLDALDAKELQLARLRGADEIGSSST
jgi:hypothetical protein